MYRFPHSLGTVLSSNWNVGQHPARGRPRQQQRSRNNVHGHRRQRPNIKGGAHQPAERRLFLIGTDEWLDYTIQFQNTGTDTAFTAVLTDTLDAHGHGPALSRACSHPRTVDPHRPRGALDLRQHPAGGQHHQ
ncbi:MAG: hypothetical protein IPN85_18985 [Flavobacteriales bacterium]|nr:hypothetical protein [Flavobacteriales bacterium]